MILGKKKKEIVRALILFPRMLLLALFVTVSLGQRGSADGQEGGNGFKLNRRSANWRNSDGTLRDAEERRAFEQGRWDERLHDRNPRSADRAPTDARLLKIYNRGRDDWRSNGFRAPPRSTKVRAPRTKKVPTVKPSTVSEILGGQAPSESNTQVNSQNQVNSQVKLLFVFDANENFIYSSVIKVVNVNVNVQQPAAPVAPVSEEIVMSKWIEVLLFSTL
jgi:hypothetical protein